MQILKMQRIVQFTWYTGKKTLELMNLFLQ